MTSNNRLHFGRDLGQDADTGFFKDFFSIGDMGIAELYIKELSGLRVCLVFYCSLLSNRLSH